MKYLKQRVPLSFDANGAPLLINRDFGDDIEALLLKGVNSSFDPTTISNAVTILMAQVATLQDQVAKLQAGYQE